MGLVGPGSCFSTLLLFWKDTLDWSSWWQHCDRIRAEVQRFLRCRLRSRTTSLCHIVLVKARHRLAVTGGWEN